jgi:hypothetical protein
MAGIFISYRREDSFAYAGRLYDHLASHFGKDSVFMDVDNIEPGLDFIEVLEQTVSSCDALVVVIGKLWLSATNEQGRRRLEDPDDLVRLEIAAALARKVRVVPTLVGGAHMPRAQDLPEAIASLSRRNALEISDLAFHQNVSRLIEALEKAVNQMKLSADPPPALASKAPGAQSVQGRAVSAEFTPSSPVAQAINAPPTHVQSGSSLPSAAIAHPKLQNQPSPANLRPKLETVSLLSGLPRWRRGLLLYWPGGASGWFFRLLFYFFGQITLLMVWIGLTEAPPADGGFWLKFGGVSGVTALSWCAALWFDKTAARKRPVLERRASDND